MPIELYLFLKASHRVSILVQPWGSNYCHSHS